MSRLSGNGAFLVLFAALFVFVMSKPPQVIDGGTPFGVNVDDIADMYTDYVKKWKQEINVAFNSAEEKILKNKPKPDDVVGPNPDPKKCICGGSGVIVQGDGHKTPCPFHGNKKETIIYTPLLILE